MFGTILNTNYATLDSKACNSVALRHDLHGTGELLGSKGEWVGLLFLHCCCSIITLRNYIRVLIYIPNKKMFCCEYRIQFEKNKFLQHDSSHVFFLEPLFLFKIINHQLNKKNKKTTFSWKQTELLCFVCVVLSSAVDFRWNKSPKVWVFNPSMIPGSRPTESWRGRAYICLFFIYIYPFIFICLYLYI